MHRTNQDFDARFAAEKASFYGRNLHNLRAAFAQSTCDAFRMPALLGSRGALESISMFEARFQSFDDSSERAQSAARVVALRGELTRRGLDGFVVPRADRQQNEYLPPSEERLAWLTGFTGSAGGGGVFGRPGGRVCGRGGLS